MKVKTTCPNCGKETILEVNENDYCMWQNGELVQRAFPYLNASQREMLITGICPECWDNMFKL